MTTALHVLCLLTSALLVVLVLAHRGSGGGLSDLLGGYTAWAATQLAAPPPSPDGATETG